MTLPSWYDNWLSTNPNDEKKFKCEVCEETFDINDMHFDLENHLMCEDCFQESRRTCSRCLGIFDEMNFNMDRELCNDCVYELEGELEHV